MLSGNMFELVAYCVAYYCVSCFIAMLCHLAFSSNVLDDWYPALVNVIDMFCDLSYCDPDDLGDLGTVDLYGTARQLVFFLFRSSLTYSRSSGRGLFFCFRHTSNLSVWSWYIVNNKILDHTLNVISVLFLN